MGDLPLILAAGLRETQGTKISLTLIVSIIQDCYTQIVKYNYFLIQKTIWKHIMIYYITKPYHTKLPCTKSQFLVENTLCYVQIDWFLTLLAEIITSTDYFIFSMLHCCILKIKFCCQINSLFVGWLSVKQQV